MARIKGITIEIDGDAKGYLKTIDELENKQKVVNNELRQTEKLLKLDPSNAVLLAQKQELVNKAIDLTNQRLEKMTELKNLATDTSKVKGSEEAFRLLDREVEKSKIELGKLTDGTQEYSKVVESASNNTSVFGDILKANLVSGAINVAISGLKKLSSTYVDLIKSGVEYNAQLETYSVMFKNLTGSSEEAERVLSKIKEDAKSTTFGTEALIKANQYLMSAGVSAYNSEKTILALGNAIASTGGGAEELKRMAQNLQQIKNVGKATSVDIKQFANAGINVYGILSDYTGKSVKQLQQMDISYNLLSSALQKASEEGGRYYNAMSSQANTYNGQVALLKANWQEFTGALAQETTNTLTNDLLPAFNKTISEITQAMGESPEKLKSVVATNVSSLIQLLTDKAPDFLTTGSSFMGAIAGGIIDSAPEFISETIPAMASAFIESIDIDGNDMVDVGRSIMQLIGKGMIAVATTIWSDIKKLFTGDSLFGGEIIGTTASGQRIIRAVNSGGYGVNSGGYGDINLSTQIVVNNNGEPINQVQVSEWSRQITDIVSKEIGRRSQ